MERLLRGDRLVHNLALDAWSLASTGDHLRHWLAFVLLRDPIVALRPAGDCLPGFAVDLSQSWASAAPAAVRRRARDLGACWASHGPAAARVLACLVAKRKGMAAPQLAALVRMRVADLIQELRLLQVDGLVTSTGDGVFLSARRNPA